MTTMLSPFPLIAGIALSLALTASAAALSEETATEPDASVMAVQAKEQEAIAKDLSPPLRPLYKLADDDKTSPRIKVDAWVDQKDLTYSVGDTMTVYAAPKNDAYITILNVGSSGRVSVIYPNRYQQELKVSGTTTVRIPSREAKWTIAIGGPAGVDLIKVIASKQPLTLKEVDSIAATDEKEPALVVGSPSNAAVRDLSPELTTEPGDTEEDPRFGVRNILVKVKAKE